MVSLTAFRRSFAFLVLGHGLFGGVNGVLQYIDDQLGDFVTGVVPVYTPASDWDTAVSGCSACDPYTDLPFNGTYTDSQSDSPNDAPRLITFHFVGTAIEIFFMTSDYIDKETPPEFISNTNVSFLLDGSSAGTFTHQPNGSATDELTFNYNVSALAKQGLDLKNHSIVIQSLGESHTFFDFATYDDGKKGASSSSASATSTSAETTTTGGDDGSQTSSVAATGTTGTASLREKTHSVAAGPIAGGVAGAVALAAIAIILVVCLRARRRRRANHADFVAAGKPILDDDEPKRYDFAYGHGPSSAYPSFPFAGSAAVARGRPDASREQLLDVQGRPSVTNSGGSGPTWGAPSSPGTASTSSHEHVAPHAYPPGNGSPQPSGIAPPTTATASQPARTGNAAIPPAIVLSPPEELDEGANAVRTKHAALEEEHARKMQEQEDRLLARAGSGSGSSSQSAAQPSSSSSSGDAAWREEVERLRAEMSRMQAVQQAVVMELGSAPPPLYSEAEDGRR
ncbi:hypothetical protein PUNSTDRAFT_118125 [Punctularia strigosozonata HHB-11173 SS5]|uniref:uncharacterized protein n=1 Tax=Punctularia strigosozonata (strain HHB-11173) TaxID=741275 RepID=UPI0004416F05|nr:uncharacterized protein PUNSTDRAFT_118125 [Punctularia strigosozonata HHB-11173 SS5]EIN14727.1 hypothetical protein PUNSTDRAFT_118125 [Punctularia strigosozonata HHB-11173 SS5]